MIGLAVGPVRGRDRCPRKPECDKSMPGEEVLFWGAAIAIFIFAGGVMILTSHFLY
jgi:hypothetical protein